MSRRTPSQSPLDRRRWTAVVALAASVVALLGGWASLGEIGAGHHEAPQTISAHDATTAATAQGASDHERCWVVETEEHDRHDDVRFESAADAWHRQHAAVGPSSFVQAVRLGALGAFHAVSAWTLPAGESAAFATLQHTPRQSRAPPRA